MIDLDDAESDDFLDDEEDERVQTDQERRFAASAARRQARWERTRPLGQVGRPIEWANESEKHLAFAVRDHLDENGWSSHNAIARALGVRQHQIYGAIWCLVGSGMAKWSRGNLAVTREPVDA